MNRASLALLLAACATAETETERETGVPDKPGAMEDGAHGVARVSTPRGIEQLAYTVIAGRAIYQGDIDLGSIQEVVGLRGGAINAGELWPNNAIRFAFHEDFAPGACGPLPDPDCTCTTVGDPATVGTCTQTRTLFRSMMDDLDDVLPVSITEVSPDSSSDFVLVRFNDDPDVVWGAHSKVGHKGGAQVLEFRVGHVGDGVDSDPLAYNTYPNSRVTWHEFMHALGFWHEQARQDRDQFIEVHEECLNDDANDNYDLESGSIDTGPYDFRSLMHYNAGKFCEIDPATDDCACIPLRKRHPLGPGDEVELGSRGVLTTEDVNSAFQHYTPSVGTNEAQDGFGRALATGDFDGDGYDDLAVGVPYEDQSATNDGVVVVYKGTSRGLVRWKTLTETAIGAVPATGEHFGYAVVAGRFDDDEFVDLAIGAPGENFNGVTAGAVFVYRGGRAGLAFVRTIDQTQQVAAAPFASDRFGAALAAGDFTNAGRDALVVGAPSDRQVAGGPNSGSFFIYQFTADATTMHKPTWFMTGVSGDGLGSAFAVGHIDSDGRADLAVGAPLATTPAGWGRGRVWLFSGRKPPENPLVWSSMVTSRTTIDGSGTSGTQFGAALALGNLSFGNAVRIDLAVGAPTAGSGEVSIFDVSSSFAATPYYVFEDSANVTGSQFGAALVIGNVDDTTVGNDLVIGEPMRQGGRVYVIPSGTLVMKPLRQAQTAFGDEDATDYFGTALAVGHIDGWGAIDDVDDKRFSSLRRLDLLVGAPGEAPNPGPFQLEEPDGAGAVNVWRGVSSLAPSPSVTLHQEWSGGL